MTVPENEKKQSKSTHLHDRVGQADKLRVREKILEKRETNEKQTGYNNKKTPGAENKRQDKKQTPKAGIWVLLHVRSSLVGMEVPRKVHNVLYP